jgi:hypothetical protein
VSYRKVVAKRVITCQGNDGGMSKTWGKLHIGAGKATIRLTHVLVPWQRPWFDYTDPIDPSQSWKRKSMSLGDLFSHYINGTEDGPEIAVHVLSLRVQIAVDLDDAEPHNLLQYDTTRVSNQNNDVLNPDESTTPNASDVIDDTCKSTTLHAGVRTGSSACQVLETTESTRADDSLAEALFDDFDGVFDLVETIEEDEFDYDAAGQK